MSIQRHLLSKCAMAQVALPSAAIPRSISAAEGGAVGLIVPSQHLGGDEVAGIALSDHPPYGFTIQILGIGARVGFEMGGNSAGGGECSLAAWTVEVTAAMCLGIEMLYSRMSNA